ncbi:hypothetical protein ACJMK2_018954 [Sinanodonta woodiana]|uniref:Ras GTPase-activating protein 3 n=1 Tax=Sinanodonta woodiana TaxID=1069815 RepID=A0ABD3UIZ1_SINWO
MAENVKVRTEETLRVKIGEAKNLPPNSVTGSGRNTFCAILLDREEIFRTATIEKSLNPFFGEEFQGEIPRKFRYLSFYIYDKNDKALGKVSLRKRELHKYHGKEHWFSLLPVDVQPEVQGKVHLEFRFDEYLSTSPDVAYASYRLAVRVIECNDLMVTNGACNPYAVVTLSYGQGRHRDEVRRTNVKKKTISPQFDETFFFDLENKGQNHDRNNYYIEDIFSGELCISVWHDESRMAREVLGSIFPGVFLGEIKISLRDLNTSGVQNAWYFLRAKNDIRQPHENVGSMRLKISYTAEQIFASQYYDDLRNVLLESPSIQPISSSAAYILGQIVDNRQEVAQPLVKVFYHHGKIVPFIKTLAIHEIKQTLDHNTLFRGNTLLTKVLDELMKLVGLPYLHFTIKSIINQICSEHLSCEIDPARLKEGENLESNMEILKNYIKQIFDAIMVSGLACPSIMCEVFATLKEAAQDHLPDKKEVRYQVVCGFIFLRFFAPAILGPRFFDLTTDTQDETVHRTLTLISKVIQRLGNLVSSQSWTCCPKEDYMVPIFEHFSDACHVEAIKMYLDIISSSIKIHSKQMDMEQPVVLKEGMLIKRAQGRKKFGLKNFKRRYFVLTNQALTYSRSKEDDPRFVLPIDNILAVEKLEEQSFKMQYMFQVIQPQRTLYIQANNCVEEKEWLDILTKVSNKNKNRLKEYHPAAYLNGHWLCCKAADQSSHGCTPVTGGLPVTEIQVDLDSDREVEKIHSLFLTHMDKMEALHDMCGSLEVYGGDVGLNTSHGFEIEDSKTCFETLNEVLKCVISLEQEHMHYRKSVQRETVTGSFETPIGDDSLIISNDNDIKL